ncbi:hypothetical protein SAMN05421684_7837 [Asanoa ishikariensis]|uniref:Uncharacterized protein n=1 Tax=Asanoa ishikariensis TaxID=137265 RepID=A0A1H3USC2_9ACTN|nr:hypothetical protein [Asanoa ishikariensis]SDZ64795.1 hypothetical protein SAMN05421684_7837 [Asanoa ishikariensis]
MELPNLAEYGQHRDVAEAEFEGVPVPGLSATFYRRPVGERLATVGHYTYQGRDLLMAWGFVDEARCRFSSVVDADGGWQPPTPGCPDVAVRRADGDRGPVLGFTVRGADGRWVDGVN